MLPAKYVPGRPMFNPQTCSTAACTSQLKQAYCSIHEAYPLIGAQIQAQYKQCTGQRIQPTDCLIGSSCLSLSPTPTPLPAPTPPQACPCTPCSSPTCTAPCIASVSGSTGMTRLPSILLPGQPVIVTGSNFGTSFSNVNVTVNGVPVGYVSTVTNNQITFVAPAMVPDNTGRSSGNPSQLISVDVVVSVNGCDSNKQAALFVVNPQQFLMQM